MNRVYIPGPKPFVGVSEELAKTIGMSVTRLQQVINAQETDKRLGRGAFREVYELNKKYVIKFAYGSEKLPNMLEVYTYLHSRGTEYNEILAPIIAYSILGEWIIMRKATRIGKIPNHQDIKVKYGKWLCDTHQYNIGAIDCHVKVIDYGQIPDDTGNGRGRIVWSGSDFTPPKDFMEIFPQYKQGD